MIKGEYWFTIMIDNNPIGQVLFETDFMPKGGDGYEELYAKYETREHEKNEET